MRCKAPASSGLSRIPRYGEGVAEPATLQRAKSQRRSKLRLLAGWWCKVLDSYEQKLLDSWEDVFKKGQLTLWIMLALKDGPKHMSEIKQFITQATNGTLSADDQSMYRALRRYYDTELVDFKQEPGKSGPELKIYSLSPIGSKVLKAFLERNILRVFFKQEIRQLIEGDNR